MNPIPILTRAVWFPANRINAVYAKCRLKCSDGIFVGLKIGWIFMFQRQLIVSNPISGHASSLDMELRRDRGTIESWLKSVIGKHGGKIKGCILIWCQ